MDILIKSFNRPYYLDRCLFSIEKYVQNYDKIIILDDGTPQKYLDKIQEKYLNTIIKKSKNYSEKSNYTTLAKQPKNYVIPIDLWLEEAANATNYFLLIEDDMWFIESIDLKDIQVEMMQNNVVNTKLIWLGNPDLIQNKKETTLQNIVLIFPKLFTIYPPLYTFIFYKFHRFKIKQILRFFKIHSEKKRIAYYTLYTVAGLIFEKKYFMQMWQNHNNTVSEGLQLFNAMKLYYKAPNKYKYARYKTEVMKTGFISSATNQFKEEYQGNVDMFIFNQKLNEAWYKNTLDVFSSLPNDISKEEVALVLDNDFEIKKWQLWVASFKNQYLKIGCKID